MDYISQIEMLYKYFEFNLELNSMRSMIELKHRFNDDLNLIGCYIKDFLTVKNDKIPNDEDIYSEFVMYFENNSDKREIILQDLELFAKYYLMIVFENSGNQNFVNAASTINSCFALEAYPILMKLLDFYYNQKVDGKTFNKMLELIVDIVIVRFDDKRGYDNELKDLELKIENLALEKRIAV